MGPEIIRADTRKYEVVINTFPVANFNGRLEVPFGKTGFIWFISKWSKFQMYYARRQLKAKRTRNQDEGRKVSIVLGFFFVLNIFHLDGEEESHQFRNWHFSPLWMNFSLSLLIVFASMGGLIFLFFFKHLWRVVVGLLIRMGTSDSDDFYRRRLFFPFYNQKWMTHWRMQLLLINPGACSIHWLGRTNCKAIDQ